MHDKGTPPRHACNDTAAVPMTEGLRIDWDGETRERWEAMLADAGRSALEQSWTYGQAVPRATAQRGVIRRNDAPIALVQVLVRRFPAGLKIAQIIRGPVLLDGPIEPDALRLIRGRFRRRDGTILVWMPELPDAPDSITAMRSAGLRRMATGYSSAWVDLRRSEDELRAGLHGKWRNMVSAAERAGLRIETRGDPANLNWLLQKYDGHRRKVRFSGPSSALIRNMRGAGQKMLVLRALEGKSPVAGILLVRHGATATYYVGWTGPEGRRSQAHNLLLWHGLLALKSAGTEWLDVGGINAAAPGVARFKMGMGGEFFTLTGTYI